MFNNNISLGSIDINFNNIKGIENGKPFAVNGKLNIGVSVNSQLMQMIQPLMSKAVEFNNNKFIGKNRIQKELDEVELLRIEVEKARLQKQLDQLRK